MNSWGQSVPAVKLVILDFYSSPMLDVTGADMIRDLLTEFSQKGIELRLANTTGQVRDLIRKAGLVEKVGRSKCNGYYFDRS